MICKILAVFIGVTVKPRFPHSGLRKTDGISVVNLIHHIHHDNDAILRERLMELISCRPLILSMVDNFVVFFQIF